MSLQTLFRPRHVAVVGASADATKVAGLPIRFLRRSGFGGAIFPVNPRATVIDGLPCFPGVDALPEAPDVALVLLGAAGTVDAVRALAARGARHAIVLASGFGEAGPDGARLQAELVEAAGPMRLLGPNTIGLVNVSDAVPLSASGALSAGAAQKGVVGVVSQSGGILGSLLSRMTAAGIGLSKLVATGNEVDLELSDFVEALADDADTRVLALYIEAIRRPERFRRAVERARAAGKPVVALKVGRSAAGARAAASHTGAMAGSDRAYDALFAELGVIRAQTVGELVDLPAALATQPPMPGRRVAILTSTGGAGTLVADAIGSAGLEAPVPGEETVARLRAAMPGGHGSLDTNPIDLTLAGLQPDILAGCMGALLESPDYDATVVIVGSSAVGRPELVGDALRAAGTSRDKPVLAYVSPHAPEAAARLVAQGVPAFAAPESVAAALSALRRTGEPVQAAAAAAAEPVPLAAEWHGQLDEHEAKRLFAAFGVPGAREFVVEDAAGAEAAARTLGGPVVLKLLSGVVTHKSDVGGVAVGLDAAGTGPALDAMRARLVAAGHPRPERFLVQEMVRGGLELILGCRRDPLGTVLLLGLGGVAAELAGDTVIRLLPPDGSLSHASAAAMMRELACWPLLDGYRGRPRLDADALAAAITGFSRMAAQLGGRLVEAEVNPLFVLPKGVVAADGVAILEPAVQDGAHAGKDTA